MSKEEYKLLCEENPVPIFSQYYWMDAVCGSSGWDVLFAETNGNILASLPYFRKGEEIAKAPLTQNNGIFFYYPPDIKESHKLDFQVKASQLIIDKIETLGIRSFRQYFHHDFKNWLPFYWRGYIQTTRYTYVLDAEKNLELLHQNMSSNTRKNIRKAERSVSIERVENIRNFYGLVVETFERQGLRPPYDFDFFANVCKVLLDRNQCEMLQAKDSEGNIHSCTMFIWDQKSVYYLMSGSKINFRNSQSLSLLIWEGIKLAHKMDRKFDFEGSMKQNIESFFRGFGPTQVPYFDITKKFK